jgi:hypothetical protein
LTPELQRGKAREAFAEQCVRVVFGAYNRADFHDPQMFVANTVALLSQYHEAVMREVCDPRTGIQTQLKWPPKVSEFREWCQRVSAEHEARERRVFLNTHRVLIDTPHGPRPESELASERPSQEARDRAVAHWEKIKAGFEGEKRKAAQSRRLEELSGQPRPMLSDAAKRAAKLIP